MTILKIICLIISVFFILIHGKLAFEETIFDRSPNLHWFQIWIIITIWILLH